MRILLEILINDYYACMARLPLHSPEYRILQNGVRQQNESGDDVVRVLCDVDAARKVRAALATHCPEIASRIRELPGND